MYSSPTSTSSILRTLTFIFSFWALPLQAETQKQEQWEVLQEQSFEPSIFTQGLFVDGDFLLVSSGGFGHSFISKIPLNNSTETANNSPHSTRKYLPKSQFAEGFSLHEGHYYLLTWKAGLAYKLDKNFEHLTSYKLAYEGWGLTSNGQQLIASDGSATLRFLNEHDFSTQRSIKVKHKQQALNKINELEWAQGYIWANVWHDDHIYKINPQDGRVEGKWDLSCLRHKLKLNTPEAVLNGIAWDETRQAFWITGKLWPQRYLIRFKEHGDSSLQALN
ncbi:glutaminyl-peptide cyclotransferase [Agaribacterium sp. ZY112]|uniref:glutaminyl-peptide cyclotransferase n=1 Tax=Agaribacterium sp. ZY112 TaxID=3233574 RepID=UPI003526BD4D